MGDRKRHLRRWTSLKTGRSSHFATWKEMNDFVSPYRGRFLEGGDKATRGQRLDSEIINNIAGYSLRVLASGMMAGITSPARPWFRLGVRDPAVNKMGPVRLWLHEVEERMRTMFAKSNVYNGLHSTYLDLGLPGTGALLIDEDVTDYMRAYSLPVGTYALTTDDAGRVNGCYRNVSFTVEQVVRKFAPAGTEKKLAARPENISRTVWDAYCQDKLDESVQVLHVIEPNGDYREGKIGPRGKKFCSCWLEIAADETQPDLKEDGYNEFPVMGARWETHGDDVYGFGPTHAAIGDIKALQVLERMKLRVLDKIVDPPMNASSEARNEGLSLVPGAVNYFDGPDVRASFTAAIQVPAQAMGAAEASIREHEARIRATYYADLWLMMASSTDGQKTAREVAELHEEKMLQLGPVMERLQDELLNPLIERTFGILSRLPGGLPEIPQEMQGMEISVDFISIMATAQKMLATTGIDRLAQFVVGLAAADPSALDNLDVDEVIEKYADSLATAPSLLRSEEAVAALRKARADAQAQAQAQQAQLATAKVAKDMSGASMEGDTALSRMVGQSGGGPIAAASGGLQ